ncbi:hypothetical protein Tco_1213261 [Tanacetum coccineum]
MLCASPDERAFHKFLGVVHIRAKTANSGISSARRARERDIAMGSSCASRLSVKSASSCRWHPKFMLGFRDVLMSFWEAFYQQIDEQVCLCIAMAAACAFRAEEMPSLISCRMASKVMTGVSDVDILLGGILFTVHSQDLTSVFIYTTHLVA